MRRKFYKSISPGIIISKGVYVQNLLLVSKLRMSGVLLHSPHASSYYIQNLKIQNFPIQNTISVHKKGQNFNIVQYNMNTLCSENVLQCNLGTKKANLYQQRFQSRWSIIQVLVLNGTFLQWKIFSLSCGFYMVGLLEFKFE